MKRSPDQSCIFLEQSAVSGEGPRVAYKDVLDRKGEVTSGGSRALASNAPASHSADVIEALEAAGCQLVGRTNMHELAYGVTGINHWSGTPVNPKYPELIPGGSSSGSAAAVAADMVDFAVGTDTGGSIRVPASCCGIVGIKPTFGRVSRNGSTPKDSSLDCIGAFAASVDMVEQAIALLVSDWKPVEPASGGRVAFITTQSDASIVAMIREKAAAVFDVEEIALPLFGDAMDAGMTIIARETYNAFGHLLETGLLGQDVADRLVEAGKISDDQLKAAERIREAFCVQVDAALDKVDGLVLPSLPRPVPTLHEAQDASAAISITTTCRPFNLSGHPAISLPVGEIDGRPVAMQLVGRKNRDEELCALAQRIELF